jgi:transcription antitermination protein NusB
VGVRRRGRELALQALYQIDVSGGDAEEFWRHCEGPPEACRFGHDLVSGVLTERERIDGLLAATAEHWRVSRLPHVDRNILRVATYELLHHPEVPASVIIDEAIEIAKRFGGGESPAFINGVLDHVAAVVGAKKQGQSVP